MPDQLTRKVRAEERRLMFLMTGFIDSMFYVVSRDPFYVARTLDDEIVAVWGDRRPKVATDFYFLGMDRSTGDPSYFFRRGRKWFIAAGEEEFSAHDGLCVGKGKFRWVDGLPLFVAQKGDKQCVIWGHKEFPARFQFVGFVAFVQGEVVYIGSGYAVDGSLSLSVVVGDREFGPYTEWNNAEVFGGKLFIEAKRDGEKFVIWDGQEYCGSEAEAAAARAWDVYRHGRNQEQPEESHEPVKHGPGVRWGQWKQGSEVTLEDGRSVKLAFESGWSQIEVIGDKLLYVARDSEDCLVIWGDWYSSPFESVTRWPQIVADEPLFIACTHKRHKRLVWGTWASKPYDDIDQLVVDGTTVSFIARKGNRLLEVTLTLQLPKAI